MEFLLLFNRLIGYKKALKGLGKPLCLALIASLLIVSCSSGSKIKSDIKLNPKDDAEIVFIPESSFKPGCPKGEIEAIKGFLEKDIGIILPETYGQDFLVSEKPIKVSGFFMYKYLITNKQFARFVKETGYKTTAESLGFGYVYDGKEAKEVKGANWAYPQGSGSNVVDKMDNPVVQVSWYDASEYAKWAGASLPTEMQWERAARGDKGSLFPWGDKWEDDRANCGLGKPPYVDDRDGYIFTNPVNAFPNGKSDLGIMDMAGNVWEWTNDWYASDTYLHLEDKNPTGPIRGDKKVIRGGSWFTHPLICETIIREKMSPRVFNNETGFRCVINKTKGK